jgi:hypothetical protein
MLRPVQAVQDFIAANANASSCSSGGSDGSSSDGNATNPGKPGGSCPNDCWGNGECLDSKCFCNTGNDMLLVSLSVVACDERGWRVCRAAIMAL